VATGVIFGAGSVGRGFIGQLFAESRLEVVFVDVVPQIIDGINRDGCYPHLTVSNAGRTETSVGPARAINSADSQRVIEAVAHTDILATAVGAGALAKIAEPLALGLARRHELGRLPVNILLCENLHAAAAYMKGQLSLHLEESVRDQVLSQVGLLETSIGRMIPVPSAELHAIHPAAVSVEPYKYLPFDVAAVKGALPEIAGLTGDPTVPFSYYTDRKLYLHNLGHCLCAYLGELNRDTYIADAINQPAIRSLVRSAMLESALALAAKYGQPIGGLIDHMDNLLARFGNHSLQDTVERVGRDPERKLAPGDRFLGAYALAVEAGTPRRYLNLALAYGLNKLRLLKGWTVEETTRHLARVFPEIKGDQDTIASYLFALKEQAGPQELVGLIDEEMMVADLV
jgi:mannitol-1-phosphate 5-dehydrogenase